MVSRIRLCNNALRRRPRRTRPLFANFCLWPCTRLSLGYAARWGVLICWSFQDGLPHACELAGPALCFVLSLLWSSVAPSSRA
ncbi:hypothetical protein B0H67DRAFT_155691 [Lasiosphaeris hirsuta]|uniref:Uncharacterized protein n=1 Tax=Lasiosphaeris hirsuta TaxID=260670 RepID=A0AA40APC7_9PEZI|nr:hypothetical protein B0H67DRAFT_155691 [Lasiosphaeris hirsuta]